MIVKPAAVFDRDHEWESLVRFCADDRPGATLGVVSGRRRQGKTYLLGALCEAAGGFYFGATEAADAESLRRISTALTAYLGPASPLHLADWTEVTATLLAIGQEHPVPVVIDEFPYLARANPELPSLIQQALRPLDQQQMSSRSRLLLCGSAMSFMGKLLAGASPLRGRAGLELVLRPLDYRLAARFWDISDPRLAVAVHSVVGGTPAYRREFSRGDTPAGPDDFDAWMTRTVLAPDSPLFREPRYLLSEEPDLRDAATYHSVLAAVAEGNTTRSGIASYLQRSAADIAHPINVLQDAGWLIREPDAFRENRPYYRIAEPLVTFYYAISRPAWSQLERPGAAPRVWAASQHRFASNVLGPHFERICRTWVMHHADPAMIGGLPSQVSHGVVNDPHGRTSHELDVVAIEAGDRGRRRLLAIGEAKWNVTLGIGHLERLRRIRELAGEQSRFDLAATKLMLFSGQGFAPELASQAAGSDNIILVTPDALYDDP